MFFDNSPNDGAIDRVRVKICGLRDASMACWAVDQGADAIGLMFYQPSPRYVVLEEAREIAKAVQGRADIVGVFVNPAEKEVERSIETVGLTGLQFHGDESKHFCQRWGLPWLKAIHVDDGCNIEGELERWQNSFACLLDTKTTGLYGGSGKRFDWSRIPEKYRSAIILSGGLDATNITEAISQVSPFAVDVSSGVESARGEKSQTLITAFMQEVCNAQKNSQYP